MHDVVLNPQIFEKELDGIIIVRLYSADFCGGHNDDTRSFFSEKFGNCRFIREIKLQASARHDVAKPLGFKPAQHRAPHHSTMAGDKDLVGFIHELAENSGSKNQQHKHSAQQQMNATLQNIRLSAGKRNYAHSQR